MLVCIFLPQFRHLGHTAHIQDLVLVFRRLLYSDWLPTSNFIEMPASIFIELMHSSLQVSQRNQLSVPFSGVSQKPEFTVHVDDVATSHPPCTPQHVSQFDKVLSARKPEKAFVTEALKNKVQYCRPLLSLVVSSYAI